MEVEKLKAEDGNVTFEPLTKQSLKNKANFTAGRLRAAGFFFQLHNSKLHWVNKYIYWKRLDIRQNIWHAYEKPAEKIETRNTTKAGREAHV